MDKNINILVVDDCPATRRIIVRSLRSLGFINMEQADDGLTALPMLRAGDFDLLITDAYMPGMPGLDLINAVRSDPELSDLPVLMVTTESRQTFILQATKAGVDGYMVKPFSEQILDRRIKEIFDRSAATA